MTSLQMLTKYGSIQEQAGALETSSDLKENDIFALFLSLSVCGTRALCMLDKL